MKIYVNSELLMDIANGFKWALDAIPDECNCHSYVESDTNAWIHEEDKCQIFTRLHLEATGDMLTKVLESQVECIHDFGMLGICNKCGETERPAAPAEKEQ